MTMDQLMGVNSRIEDTREAQMRFTYVRLYAPWAHPTGYANADRLAQPVPNGTYNFDPSRDGGWDYDQYLAQLAGAGNFTLLGLSPWLRGIDRVPDLKYLDLKPYYVPAFGPASQAAPTIDWSSATDAQVAARFTVGDNVVQSTPATYLSHAAAATWTALRYGSGPTNANLELAYQLAEGEANAPRRLNTLGSFENHNESDKWWHDNSFDPTRVGEANALWQMRPEQLAAMTSADYDGHGQSAALRVPTGQGTTQAQLGLKLASPDTYMALSGLSNFRTGYLGLAIAWWRAQRRSGQYGFSAGFQNNVLPLDAFNFHHYANIASPRNLSDFFAYEANPANFLRPFDWETQTAAADAISPEEERLKDKLKWTMWEIAKAAGNGGADTVMSVEFLKKSFWLSEFGYDTELSGQSSYDVPGTSKAERWLRQAQWNVRSFLEISAAQSNYTETGSGVPVAYQNIAHHFTRAHVYELRDEFVPEGASPNQFQTSGLLAYDPVRQVYTKKNSWYFLLAMREALQGYQFVEELTVIADAGQTLPQLRNRDLTLQNVLPRAYLYRKGNDYRIAWWAPSSTDYTQNLNVTLVSTLYNFIPASVGAYDTTRNPQAYELVAGSERPMLRSYLPGGIGTDAGSPQRLRITQMPTTETPRFIDLDDVIAPERTVTFGNFYTTAMCCDGGRVRWDYSLGTGNNNIPRPYFNVYAIPTSCLPAGAATYVPGMPGTIDVALGTSLSEAYIGGLQQGVSYFVIVYAVNRTSGAFIAGSSGGSAFGTTTMTPNCGSTPCYLPVQSSWLSASSSTSLAQAQQLFTFPLTCNLPRPSGNQGDCGPFFFESGRPTWTAPVGEWITVTFPQPQLINALVLEDDFGIGDLIIEGKQCDCETAWQPIKSYRTNSRCPQTFITFNGLGKWKMVRFRKTYGDPKIGPVGFCTESVSYLCNGLIEDPDPPGPGPGASPQGQRTYVQSSPEPRVQHNVDKRVTIEWPLATIELLDPPAQTAERGQEAPVSQGAKVVEEIRHYTVQLFADGKAIEAPQYVHVLPQERHGSFTFENLWGGKRYEAVVMTALGPGMQTCQPPGNPQTGGTVIFYAKSPPPPTAAALHLNDGGANEGASDGAGLSYEDWALFPNPSTGPLTIEHPAGAQQVMVIDALGRIINSIGVDAEATRTVVELAVEESGMHIVALRYPAQTLRRMVFLQH